VSYHDPYIPVVPLEEAHGHGDGPARRLTSVPLTEETLGAQDCTCLAVAHSAFDIPWLLKHSRLLMDATGVTRLVDGGKSHVTRIGDGRA